MRPACMVALLGAAVCLRAAASEMVEVVNGLRAPASRCSPAPGLAPLVARPALEQAAAALANGAPLRDGLKAAGYRASAAQAISVAGSTERAKLEAVIAARFCAQVTDARLSEIGVHRSGARTWIVLAAPFAPKVALPADEAVQRVLQLVNQARAAPRSCGEVRFQAARPLRLNDLLAQASQLHADHMARHNYFSHGGSDGSTPAQRVARAGYAYRATGENIAAGPLTPDAAVNGWINSAPHCANLMNPAYTEMGIAFAINPASDAGVYWVQVFGTPR